MYLSRFPRVTLAHLPTALEFLPRLSRHLGGPDIYIKRDDCTGLATGGNKTRKLEFSMGEAMSLGADTIITVGAIQSNHVRQTAAAACKLGMSCEVLLEQRVGDTSELYRHSGNVLLDRIFGANIREYEKGADFAAEMERLAGELRASGRNPYVIPGGASNPVGALGYVNCALELVAQANDMSLTIDHIVHATGSAGTQAGLVTGLKAMNCGIPLLGIGVNVDKATQEQRVADLAIATAEYLGAPSLVSRQDVVANCDYVGDGYGLPTPGMNEAVLMLARLEGILADPVYSGKALAGLFDLIRTDYFADASNIVFIHTGGSAGLFAYGDLLSFTR
jgi:L-cysteate sulfo-lyase